MGESKKKSKSTLAKKEADAVRGGDEQTVPVILKKGLSPREAIKILQQMEADEQRIVAISEVFEAYPSDGAVALQKALAKRYGWTRLVPTPSFFGPEPPTMVSVSVGVDETIKVPWGRMTIPGIEGWIETNATNTKQGPKFVLQGQIKQKFQKSIVALCDDIRDILRTESIYRGRSLRVNFTGNYFDTMKFLDLSEVKPDELILRERTEQEVEACVFAPIRYSETCRKLGVQPKRGVLLLGDYGCGKTLIGRVAAKHAQDNGKTFLLLDNVEHLAMAIELLVSLGGGILFAEDLNRVVGADRSVKVDQILNTIDGVAHKDVDVMVILTTNNVEEINKAMLRPGRMDAVIEVTPPDEEAAQRLMRLYGRGLIEEDADLSEAGRILSGKIPAVIREAVERAKLFAMNRMRLLGVDPASVQVTISGEALAHSAESVMRQVTMIDGQKPEPTPKLEAVLVSTIMEAIRRHEETPNAKVPVAVAEIHDSVVNN